MPDAERIPLKQSIAEYFESEVLGQLVQGQEPFTGARMGRRQRFIPQIIRGLIPLGEIKKRPGQGGEGPPIRELP